MVPSLVTGISLYDLRAELNLARCEHFFKGGMRQHNQDCEKELRFRESNSKSVNKLFCTC